MANKIYVDNALVVYDANTGTQQSKRKISEAGKGNQRARAGKGTPKPPRTLEWRRKMSEYRKAHPYPRDASGHFVGGIPTSTRRTHD